MTDCQHPADKRFYTWNYPDPMWEGSGTGWTTNFRQRIVCALACRCGQYQRPYQSRWRKNPVHPGERIAA